MLRFLVCFQATKNLRAFPPVATLSVTFLQDVSFGGFHGDNVGKGIVGDSGLNGVILGPAMEITPGWKPVDRLAVYNGGSGSDTLTFLYTVQRVGIA